MRSLFLILLSLISCFLDCRGLSVSAETADFPVLLSRQDTGNEFKHNESQNHTYLWIPFPYALGVLIPSHKHTLILSDAIATQGKGKSRPLLRINRIEFHDVVWMPLFLLISQSGDTETIGSWVHNENED